MKGVFPLALLLTLALGVLDAPTARVLAAEPVRASSLLHAALGTQCEAARSDAPLQVDAEAPSEASSPFVGVQADCASTPRLACRRGESGLAPPRIARH